MGITLFWLTCLAIWIYLRVTTPAQRRQWLHSGWTLLLICAACGFVWELLGGS